MTCHNQLDSTHWGWNWQTDSETHATYTEGPHSVGVCILKSNNKAEMLINPERSGSIPDSSQQINWSAEPPSTTNANYPCDTLIWTTESLRPVTGQLGVIILEWKLKLAQ